MQSSPSWFKRQARRAEVWWLSTLLLVALLPGSVDANAVALDRERADRLEGRRHFSQLAYLADPMTATDEGYPGVLPICPETARPLRGDDGVGLQIHGGLSAPVGEDPVLGCETRAKASSRPAAVKPTGRAMPRNKLGAARRAAAPSSRQASEAADREEDAAQHGALTRSIPRVPRWAPPTLTSSVQASPAQVSPVEPSPVEASPDEASPNPPSAAQNRRQMLETQLVATLTQARLLMAELEREGGAPAPFAAGQDAAAAPEPQYVVSNGEGAWDQGDILVQLADAQERRRLVARVQSRLAELGHDPGPVDGIYGPLTRGAVADFQETTGLDADGQITLAMLDALTMAEGPAEDAAPSDLVAEAQLLLDELGFEAGPTDGIAGEQTVAAVRAYQRAAGLSDDGRINEALVAHLIAARELQLDEGAPAAPVVTSGEEIDEEDIARALERSLIEEGGILLPPWVVQATTGFRYVHESSDELRIVNIGGLASVAQQDRRSDVGQASVTLRLGLPWDAQVETFIPYIVAHEDIVTAQTVEQERDGHGLGDVEFAFTKQILREGEWVPNLLTSVGWKTDTGETEFDPNSDNLSTGTGYHSLSGTATLTKSKDPFVFFGNLGYTYNFSHEVAGTDVEPGNEIDVGIGAILAAGPDTSLRVSQRQTFINETALDGSDIAGSDQVQSIFEVGGSVVLSSNALFDIALGIGLTDDSPDYQIDATLPIRF